jgi:crotonobetainyl-CoA:carnitine CoA-transferase CaiB-like acyl-CoA transferase
MLDDLVIVDLSHGAARTCADILASFGARLERPEARGPLSETLIRTMAHRADVLILGPSIVGAFESVAAREALAAMDGRLVVVTVTTFGLSGPYARFRGGELVASAMGGVLRLCGYPDRPPVKEAGNACWFHANAMAAAGAMIALHEGGSSGRGQLVDVSVQEVAASRTTNAILAWQFDRRQLMRSGPAINYGRAPARCVWELADGHVFHSLMTGRFGAPANQALSDWMDERLEGNPLRGVDWLAYDRSALPAETRALWEDAIARFFKSLTRAEIVAEGRRRGVNAAPLNQPLDLFADEQLAAREFFVDRDVGGRNVRVPGRFVRSVQAGSPGEPKGRPAPRRGESPLAGLKVLDFSWALVGSFATKTLGDFGATVVKVESGKRPCLSRIDVQTSASRKGGFDDKPWFAHMNSSKLGLRLDLKHPRAREVIGPLVDWADIVIENFSPGTMASLGLDYETLSARRPDIVMVSGSVYGQTGPLAKEWGVDGTGAALSGRLALTGWPDRTPVPPSAVPYGDVVLPPIMAAAALAAVHDQRRTGRGRHIDASMYEVCAMQMADALIRAQTGPPPRRDGNRDPAVLLQGVYPTSGEDRWIAVTIEDQDAWARFKSLAGGADWPDDLAGLTRGQKDALEGRIAAWTATQHAPTLMLELQRAGVAAGAVQDARDIVEDDPQLRERGFLAEVDHPVLGRFACQGTPIALSRSSRPMFAAPRLGEHTELVCGELIGMDRALLESLRADNVFE